MIRSYLLTGEATARAFEAGGPLVDLKVDPAKLADMQIAAVEVNGQIVAYWVLWKALHLEPLWITEEFRQHPAVALNLIQTMEEAALATGEPAGFAVIEQENLATVGQYAERIGFQRAPGLLYYLLLQQPESKEGG